MENWLFWYQNRSPSRMRTYSCSTDFANVPLIRPVPLFGSHNAPTMASMSLTVGYNSLSALCYHSAHAYGDVASTRANTLACAPQQRVRSTYDDRSVRCDVRERVGPRQAEVLSHLHVADAVKQQESVSFASIRHTPFRGHLRWHASVSSAENVKSGEVWRAVETQMVAHVLDVRNVHSLRARALMAK